MPQKIAKGVHWVGIVDWGLTHFHGHELSTHRGTTYNAYLVVDEKIALVDTAWGPFAEELIANIRAVVDPARIDYIVVNHAEVDHSGSLPAVLRVAPDATVVTSQLGAESVAGHYDQDMRFQAVATGDRIHLGEGELVFVEAPMLHWPDSMFTYLTSRNLLMSSDAFGQHYASAFRFNDQVDQTELFEEALKYYANILTPFCPQVGTKIEELLDMKLQVDIIAPSHGVIWRKDPLSIVRTYQEWAAQRPRRKAVILYDTMWEATRRMAEAVGRGLAAEGVPYRLYHMAVSDRNDVLAEIFTSGAVIVGSPTLNAGLLPSITPVLEDLRGLRFRNKVGAAFCSYGWTGEAASILEERLRAAGIAIAADSVSALWQPKAADLASCEEMGRKVARALPEERS